MSAPIVDVEIKIYIDGELFDLFATAECIPDAKDWPLFRKRVNGFRYDVEESIHRHLFSKQEEEE